MDYRTRRPYTLPRFATALNTLIMGGIQNSRQKAVSYVLPSQLT